MQRLSPIDIKVVSHKKQRYNTVGDYFYDKGNLHVRISKTKPDYEFLVLVHELIEWYLTQRNGLTIEQIDNFDKSFKGDEPGDAPDCPYFKEHQFATYIEEQIADELEVDWDKYEKYLSKL